MLISHRKKFIYTKTVRTAGTSVEIFFEKYCMPEGKWQLSHTREEYVSSEGIIGFRRKGRRGAKWRNHMPAEEIKRRIGDDIWNRYFKFCVIRDPFDKLISEFHFLSTRRDNYTFRQRLVAIARKMLGRANPIDLVTGENNVDRFRSWIRKGGGVIDRDKYLIDGEMCMDFFIRFEDLEAGIRQVCQRLGVPFEPEGIPSINSGTRPRDGVAVNEYYDPETIDLVSKLYQFELETFGYRPPQPSRVTDKADGALCGAQPPSRHQ